MVFKRRDRRPFRRILLELLWPRGGWGRAAIYVKHRVNRLPDPPEKIARGVAAGVFTTFTPFYGFHFFTAVLLAWILRGNFIASILATFVGNPLTYVPIGIIAMKTGYFLLGLNHGGGDPDQVHVGLGRKFVNAGEDLWHNIGAMFTQQPTDWTHLRVFYDEVFFPYLIGGIIPGLIAGIIGYYVSYPLIKAYQNRRKGILKAKLDAMKKQKNSHRPAE